MEYDVEINKCGDKFYYKKGRKIFHRTDGPAIEWRDGDKEWYIDGKRHRENGPALERKTVNKWFIDGQLHRVSGPAVEYRTGDKEYWVDGKLHRIDGPAIEYKNGYKIWCIDGKMLPIEKTVILNKWWDNKNGI